MPERRNCAGAESGEPSLVRARHVSCNSTGDDPEFAREDSVSHRRVKKARAVRQEHSPARLRHPFQRRQSGKLHRSQDRALGSRHRVRRASAHQSAKPPRRPRQTLPITKRAPSCHRAVRIVRFWDLAITGWEKSWP